MKLVIIDDETQILALLKTALEKQGFSVVTVSDPLRAVDIVAKELPRLVLSDLMMPRLDGHGVARQLRANPLTATIPIAFLSAAPPAENLPRAFRDGVVGYFEKPFHPARLGTQLQELIKDLAERKNELRGSLRSTSIRLLIELMQRDQRSGLLNIKGDEHSARIVFKHGSMTDVAVDGMRGPEAAQMLTGIDEGDFILESADGATSEVVEVTEQDLDIVVEEDDLPSVEGEPINETLLVVDDEPDILNVLRRSFEAHGYHVVAAATGNDALGLAREARPDAIVCDVMLPEMDGWQIYHQVRADYRINEARFVFLSAFPDLEAKLRGMGVDADGYVAKGTLMSQMMIRIDQLLQPRRSLAALLHDGLKAPFTTKLEPLGIKHVLRTLFETRFTGSLQAENMWHRVGCDFALGQPVGILDQGMVGASGKDAFLALCGMQAGDITLSPNPRSLPTTLATPFAELLRWAEDELTAAEQRVVDTNLTTATQVDVDDAALEFFAQLAPRRLEPIIAMLRARQLPRDVIGGVNLSPTETEDVLRDLVRKHIIRFD